MKKLNLHLVVLGLSIVFSTSAQENKIPEVKLTFNESGSHYLKFTGLNQVWVRNSDLNPGSTLYGNAIDNISDIGIRRLRFQVYGQLTDKVFFYAQFGQNNLSFLQPRYTGSFFHDAITEFAFHEKYLSIGGGLTGWSGLARYASPSVGSMLTLDAPLYQQATNGVNDQFLRKLSVYAKGQISRLDYRLAITKPMAVQNSTASIGTLNANDATWNTEPSQFQYQGYFKWQLMDNESNTTPYNIGSYLGNKKVLALGAGFIQQSNATWRLSTNGDSVRHDMLLLCVDMFYDTPLNSDHSKSLTLYGAFTYYDFGANYIRNVGVMNPVNGINVNGTMSGSGNNFPMIGTGNTLYAQAGFAFGKNIFTEGGKLQPYIASQYSVYKALNEPMLMAEGGINYFIHGSHGSKVSLNYQSRPVFDANTNGEIVELTRKGMTQLQYQISF